MDYSISEEEFKKQLRQMYLDGVNILDIYSEAYLYCWLHPLNFIDDIKFSDYGETIKFDIKERINGTKKTN